MPLMPASILATPALANSLWVADSMPFLPAPTPIKPPIPTATAPSLRVTHPAPHPDDTTICTDNCTNAGHLLPPTITIPPQTCSQCQPCCSPCLHTLNVNQHPPCDPVSHTACHGNAFNPNTSELAEYKELSTSSNGIYWQQANATEIHCLAQGMAEVPGTNTMFFIPVSAIPKDCHATYLCMVCAH